MSGVWGTMPQEPREVFEGVETHARRLGRGVAGDDLFLLALSELADDQPARRALEAEGLDSDRIVEEIRSHGDAKSEWEGNLRFAPSFYSMKGRAEGFAAALGDGTVTPEHVLMALLWDPMTFSSQLVSRMGASRQRVFDLLREAGVPMPQAVLPAQREIERGEQVWIDRDQVQAVVSYVGSHVPPDTAWGFNYEGERAWISAESNVDLQLLVDEALAGTNRGT